MSSLGLFNKPKWGANPGSFGLHLFTLHFEAVPKTIRLLHPLFIKMSSFRLNEVAFIQIKAFLGGGKAARGVWRLTPSLGFLVSSGYHIDEASLFLSDYMII